MWMDVEPVSLSQIPKLEEAGWRDRPQFLCSLPSLLLRLAWDSDRSTGKRKLSFPSSCFRAPQAASAIRRRRSQDGERHSRPSMSRGAVENLRISVLRNRVGWRVRPVIKPSEVGLFDDSVHTECRSARPPRPHDWRPRFGCQPPSPSPQPLSEEQPDTLFGQEQNRRCGPGAFGEHSGTCREPPGRVARATPC